MKSPGLKTREYVNNYIMYCILMGKSAVFGTLMLPLQSAHIDTCTHICSAKCNEADKHMVTLAIADCNWN